MHGRPCGRCREMRRRAHRRRRRDFARRLERERSSTASDSKGSSTDSERELDDDWDPSQSFPSHRSCNRAAANRLETRVCGDRLRARRYLVAQAKHATVASEPTTTSDAHRLVSWLSSATTNALQKSVAARNSRSRRR